MLLAPTGRRGMPSASRIARISLQARSVSSAIWRSESPSAYLSTTNRLRAMRRSPLSRLRLPFHSGSGFSRGRDGYGTTGRYLAVHIPEVRTRGART